MNLNKIKDVLSGTDENIKEIDILLTVDYLLSYHRSVFLDQKVYDLSHYHYSLLKDTMIKSMDLSEDSDGNIVQYRLIPITVRSSSVKGYSPVIENIDPAFIKNVLVTSGILKENTKISKNIISMRTMFGGNIYNAFDTIRDSLQPISYMEKSTLIAESSGQFVFYAVISELDVASDVDTQDWYEKLHFVNSRISKCCGTEVEILPPVSPSKEIYSSLFRDALPRLSSFLSFSELCTIDMAAISISSERSATLLLSSEGEALVALELGNVSNYNIPLLEQHLETFSLENDFTNGKISIIEDEHPKKQSVLPKKSNFLRIVK
jgi:hypothetical protein